MAQVLQGGQFILGDEVAGFECSLAEYVGARHAVGVSSGTDAPGLRTPRARRGRR
ncbi:MAG: DegT/DnrJ/EryC1/StrS family aminotransferase [Polyangiaceae bacterium]